jgi:hypothetical protein
MGVAFGIYMSLLCAVKWFQRKLDRNEVKILQIGQKLGVKFWVLVFRASQTIGGSTSVSRKSERVKVEGRILTSIGSECQVNSDTWKPSCTENNP